MERGFTLLEVLVATLIMAIGFLATAQMGYLAFKRHQLAARGTEGANLLQYLSDRDLGELKRIHMLNSIVYLDAQAGRQTDTSYCDGSAPTSCSKPPCSDPCSSCPCNPFTRVTNSVTDGNVSTVCAAVDAADFDPSLVRYRTTVGECENDAAAIVAAGGTPLYVVRRSSTQIDTTTTPTTLTIDVTYAVKTPEMFADSGMSVLEKDSTARMSYELSGHLDDWSTFVAGWNQVWIPHVP